MDPATPASKEKSVKSIEFVDMDKQQIEEKKADTTNVKLTQKEKKAAYMREYHKRKQAEKKEASKKRKEKDVAEHLSKQVSSIAKSQLVDNPTSNNVVDFSRAMQLKDPETIKLWMLSQAIDNLVVQAVADGLKPTDVAGVLANRLKAACNAVGEDTLQKIKDRIL